MNKENTVFTKAFKRCTREVPFNPAWTNGGGHFDFAVYGDNAPALGNGDIIKSCTPGGRRILILGTRLGNLAVFDRFKNQQEGEQDENKAVFFYSCPKLLETGGWFSRNYLDEYEMFLAVGDEAEGNLGWRIEQLRSALRDPKV